MADDAIPVSHEARAPISPLAAAMADLSSGNVTTGLEFLIQQAIEANNPARCYLPSGEALIRKLAASRGSEVRAAQERLKQKYGKDFLATRFKADVRETKAEIDQIADDRPAGMLIADSGKPRPLLANAIIQLQASTMDLRFDAFASRMVHHKPSPWATDGVWRDLDDVSSANYLQHAGVDVSSATAHEAAVFVAHRKAYHPVKDWLNSLAWDGTGRVERWAIDYMGVDDSELTWAMSSAWMISAVSRIMRPGCKADYMLVLEGPQRQGKSSALRALCNGHMNGMGGIQWFRDGMPDIHKPDIGLFMQGVWIVEIGELAAIRGRAWEDIKAFVSRQSDPFRTPYGRNLEDYPRQCIFAGTTNDEQWGGDQTGLTRFWPMRPTQIDIPGLLAAREQLWAEAVHRFKSGEISYLDKNTEAMARVEQEKRLPEHPLKEDVLRHAEEMYSAEDYVSVPRILDKMGIAKERFQSMASSVGLILKMAGWVKFQRRITGGGSVGAYQKGRG